MTEDMRHLLAEDPGIATWWATTVECSSALARRARSGALDPTGATGAHGTLAALARSWIETPPTARVRDAARRLVRLHDFAVADAFQLAAAFEAADDQPESLELVTLDARLAAAARREGFRTLP